MNLAKTIFLLNGKSKKPSRLSIGEIEKAFLYTVKIDQILRMPNTSNSEEIRISKMHTGATKRMMIENIFFALKV